MTAIGDESGYHNKIPVGVLVLQKTYERVIVRLSSCNNTLYTIRLSEQTTILYGRWSVSTETVKKETGVNPVRSRRCIRIAEANVSLVF